MRVLVTGGAGFLGSALVDRLLAEGHTVDALDDLSTGSLANLADARADRSHLLGDPVGLRPTPIDAGQAGARVGVPKVPKVPDRSHFSFQQLDVADPAVVDVAVRRRPDVVVHLAGGHDRAGSIDDPVATTGPLVTGLLRVLDAARAAAAAKVVVAVGASDLYGEHAPATQPLREGVERRPDSPLGVALGSMLAHLGVARDLHQLEHTVLALPTIYGPRQRPDRTSGVVAALAAELVAGRPGVVHGDGAQTRDLLYVDDAVDGMVRALDRGGGLVCNLGTGQGTSIMRLHELLAEEVGAPGIEPGRAPARRHDRRHLALDPGRARIHLGWAPFTALAEGLAEVVAWHRHMAPGA